MEKQTLRERIWDDLEESGAARFPFPPHGRIPNFAGAADAAERLAESAEWEAADAIKANPDAPQLPARRRALRAGTTVYMAVPRLRDEECFIELDPARIEDLDAAPTVSAADEHGERVLPEALPTIDLILVGSVAVTEEGARVGKGEGYSDLEFGVLREFGLVDDDTPAVTTVHERQVVDAEIPTTHLDVPLDRVHTPERTVRTETANKPDGIAWDALDDDRIEAIPVLDRLR